MTTPAPISTPVLRMSDDTRRTCQLLTKRAQAPEAWTFSDHTELMQLERKRQLAAEAAALAHDVATEARAWPEGRKNFKE